MRARGDEAIIACPKSCLSKTGRPADSGPRLGLGRALGAALGAFDGRVHASVAALRPQSLSRPSGASPSLVLVWNVPPPSTGAPAEGLRGKGEVSPPRGLPPQGQGRAAPLAHARGAPRRGGQTPPRGAPQRDAPEGKLHKCERELFWTAIGSDEGMRRWGNWAHRKSPNPAPAAFRSHSPIPSRTLSPPRNSAMQAGCLRRRLCHAQRKEIMDEEGGPFPPPPLAKPDGGTPTLGRLFRLRLKGPQSLIR
jgi:hypothetical protein